MEAVIVPTCVPKDREDLIAKIKQVSDFSTSMHVDIDDGIMTPETSWPYVGKGKLGESGESERILDIPVDNFVMQVHLMVSEPRETGEFFIRAGISSLVAHVESYGGNGSALRSTFDSWRARGVREIGLAILLDTPLRMLDPLLPSCDFLQVLSVATIGAQGAPFDKRAIGRIETLHARFPDVAIAVDGGVSPTTIAPLARAGASRFSVGAAIMHSPDPALSYAQLREIAQDALQ